MYIGTYNQLLKKGVKKKRVSEDYSYNRALGRPAAESRRSHSAGDVL